MANANKELIEFIAQFTKDPYRFVIACFPWGEGELANYSGPDAWQVNIMDKISKGLMTTDQAIKLAVASGHGIG